MVDDDIASSPYLPGRKESDVGKYRQYTLSVHVSKCREKSDVCL